MPPPAEGFAARFVVGPALRTQPDRRLVTLVREGYENAFEEIVRRYGKALTRYAAAIVGGRAEDVTQDAFSKALLALRRDGKEIELRPWLFRIVRNTALNELRDHPVEAEALAEAIAGGADPEEEIEQREELADLMRRLQSLPEAQRAAIVMRELEGLSHDEIAAALGLSGGAARQTIFRARRALRDGAGMLLPLPLLKALIAGAASAPVEAAAGAAGVGGVAGVGIATKATVATVLVAGAVGAGVAIDHEHRANSPPVRAGGVVADDLLGTSSARTSVNAGSAEPGDDSGGSDGRGRSGEAEAGDDHGGHGGGSSDDGGGSHSGHGGGSGGNESGDDRGPGGGRTEPGDDRDGSGSSGHDRADSEGESRQSGSDSSGTSGSGDSSGGSSGSGSGGSSSGSGSSGSGSSGDGGGASGSFGSGTSGSGSGDSSGSSGGSDSSSSSGSSGGSGDLSGGDSSSSGSSGDSEDGSGFSLQTEPQS